MGRVVAADNRRPSPVVRERTVSQGDPSAREFAAEADLLTAAVGIGFGHRRHERLRVGIGMQRRAQHDFRGRPLHDLAPIQTVSAAHSDRTFAFLRRFPDNSRNGTR